MVVVGSVPSDFVPSYVTEKKSFTEDALYIKQEKEFVLIVVLIAEINDMLFINETIELLQQNYSDQLNKGILDIVVPALDYYTDFYRLIINDNIFNDTQDRVKWRTKQNLDTGYLMSYCYERSNYYIHVIYFFF